MTSRCSVGGRDEGERDATNNRDDARALRPPALTRVAQAPLDRRDLLLPLRRLHGWMD